MRYDFRLAESDEIAAVFSLYEKRVQWMDKSGVRQWNATDYLAVYPIGYYVERQRRKELYVLSGDEGVVGAVVLLQSDESWSSEADSPAYYVHNLVTSPSVKGAGRIILSEAEKTAVGRGMRFMRLDCAEDNEFLNSYYDSLGYRLAGRCEDGAYIGNKREKALCP